MSELVPASHIFFDVAASKVNEALKFFSEKAVEAGVASDADAVLEAFKAREAEGTTGMMGGFAIPHAKSDAITAPAVFVAKFSEGIEWASMDNEPITCAIALLTPATEAGTTHLTLLSKVAVLLMDESFRSNVQAATDADAIAALVDEGLSK